MKWLLLFVILPCWAWAQVEIYPLDPRQNVFPGDLVEIKVQLLDESLVNVIQPAQWRKLGSSKTFLFMAVSAWEKDASGWHLQGKLVVGPEFRPDAPVSVTIATNTVELRFKGWMWNPQAQAMQKDFEYEDVPLLIISWLQKHLFLVLILVLLIFSVAGGFVWRWNEKRKKKALQLRLKYQWEEKISAASDIQSLSQLWKDRDVLKELFPNSAQAQREFFDLLNQSQFKPRISEEELKKLVSAKSILLSKIKEPTRGV